MTTDFLPCMRALRTMHAMSPELCDVRKGLSDVVTRVLEFGFPTTSSATSPPTSPVILQKSPFDFESGQFPTISLGAYIERFVNGSWCSAEGLTMALVILDRVVSRSGIVMTPNNVFLLFAASFTIASKIHDDKFYTNRWFAYVAGVTTRELNALELAALLSINFDVNVTASEWGDYNSILFSSSSSSTSSAPLPSQELA